MFRNLLIAPVVLCSTSAMAADVALSFSNTTPTETRAAVWKLAQVNEVRVAHDLAAFATVKDYLEDIIVNQLLPQWIHQQAEAQETTDSVQDLWRDATEAQRAAAVAALTT